MDPKSSGNAFTTRERDLILGKERKRLYSWTRPSKHLPRKSRYDSEMTIHGSATLAFSPDLRWFQGNVISDHDEAYTITGRLKHDSTVDTIEEELENDVSDIDKDTFRSSSMRIGSKLSSISEDEQFTPPSDSDSLDPEIVREALENLGIDEDELEFKVSIMDYETGINHSLENVSCSILSDICRMNSDDLTFTSDSCSKGARADLVILRSIGQSLTDSNMLVFQGELTYTYDDMVCYPAASSESQPRQWCL